MEVTSLGELFDGEEPVEATEVETPEVETVEATEETQEAATGEESDAPPASEPDAKPPEGYVPQGALADERGKRQDLQRQLDELNGRLMQLNQKPQTQEEAEEEVNFFDDPDKYMARKEEAIQARIQQVEQRANMQVLTALEVAAKGRHEDYDAQMAVFAEKAQANPALLHEAAAANDPAEFAYQAGRRLSMLDQGGGDLDALIKQREEAAIANYLKEHPTPGSKAAGVPSSLSTVTGATTQNVPFTQPSIDQILDQ